ncbi:MAG: excinuclease ABC subunit C, partial [candidate division WOR-3 bacterium]
ENEGRWLKLSKELKEKLSLKKIPQRIEAFDMSNLSGSDPVGSMVVFIEGKEAKSEYRRFSIKDAPARDDIKMHREVLLRRLSHSEWEPPDLIVIDGTINHLRALVPIIDQFKLEVDMIAISKSSPHDRIWKPTGEIVLPTDDPVFLFIQRIRDEAHRFAISYQRKKRSKSTFN